MSKTIDELIATARQELATPETVDFQVIVGGEFVTLGFEKISGRDWNDHIALCPAREGSTYDERIGFNVDALAERLAPICGYQIVDGEHISLPLKTWGDLFGFDQDDDGLRVRKTSVLSAADIRLIGSALWGINVYEQKKKADALKKASQPKNPRKRS